MNPTKIILNRKQKLIDITYSDGVNYKISAELLRVLSPSAEVRGHGIGQKKVVSGRRHVGIIALERVGNYAVRIKFDDLHDTGIYTWNYLRELGEKQSKLMADYTSELANLGLTREP